MKLSEYAKQQGTSYSTAFRWWKAGNIKGYQAPTGTIIVTTEEPIGKTEKVALYARVSTRGGKITLNDNLNVSVLIVQPKVIKSIWLSKKLLQE